MGLDMYLYAEKYLSDFRHSTTQILKDTAEATGAAKYLDTEQDSTHGSFRIKVAYWRKANAIHGWFVDKVQDGEDNCQESYVSRTELVRLIEECKAVIADPEQADDLLPPRAGFFFGSGEVDAYYMEDLKYTVKRLTELLPMYDEGWELYYQASW